MTARLKNPNPMTPDEAVKSDPAGVLARQMAEGCLAMAAVAILFDLWKARRDSATVEQWRECVRVALVAAGYVCPGSNL